MDGDIYRTSFIKECIELKKNHPKLRYDVAIYIDMNANITHHKQVSVVEVIQLINESINKYVAVHEIVRQNIISSYEYYLYSGKILMPCEIITKALRFAR